MANLIGQTIGQYEITALLGKGGMAAVYRARQAKVDRDVAIKIIKPDLAESPDFLRRFEREAKTIAGLSHPNIVKLFDYGEQDGTVYLVMELMTGGTLDRLIRGKGLSPTLVSQQLEQIASALDYAHVKGIIHRDLKPQNVLLDEGQNAYLTDFGIARLAGATALTKSGAAMGTPFYMSPEQWRGASLDARSDIYALGIMTYEMLTGNVPFTGDTPLTIMYHHLHDNPPTLRIQNPDLPAALDDVIRKAVAKEPEARFQSAQAMATAIQAVLSYSDVALPRATSAPANAMAATFRTMNTPTADPTVPAKKRAANRSAILTAAVAAVVLVVGGILLAATQLNRPIIAPTAIAADINLNLTAPAAAAIVLPSSTDVITFTPSVTPNLVAVAETSDAGGTQTLQAIFAAAGETLAAAQTATATHWTFTPAATDTPTEDVKATLQAVLRAETKTAQDILDQTATATVWTKTPTSTYTPSLTPTYTPSSTPSITPSVTPSVTDTPLPSPTVAPSAATVPTTAVPAFVNGLPITPTFDSGELVLRAFNAGSGNALDALRNVWSFVGFRDSFTPGTQTYNVSVQNRPLSFTYFQCGFSESELQAVKSTISVSFAVNNVQIPDSAVYAYEYHKDKEYCRRWGVVLEGWQSGSTVTLEMRYFMANDLAVEGVLYQAGDYQHILQTRVR